MNTNNLITSVENYYKLYPYNFYKKILDLLKNKYINKNIYKIKKNEFILEAIRIHICYNVNNYKIVLTSTNPKKINIKTCYRKLYTTNRQLNNIIYQIYTIENNNLFYKNINDNYELIKKKLILDEKKNKYKIYILFINKDNNIYINKSDILYENENNIYELISLFLGIESLNFMKYQRLDRIYEYMSNNKSDIKQGFEYLSKYNEIIKKLNWIDKEKYILFSGIILNLLGTTYTLDIDLLVIASEENKDYFNKIDNILNEDFYDYHVLLNDKTWYKKNEILLYQKKWLTYILPRLGGAEDIFDVFANPKHHFYYNGIKCISINITIQRLISRISTTSIPDLIMLNKINNVKLDHNNICIPNMNIRHGNIIIYTNKVINNLYYGIIRNMKEWHNIDITINEIKILLKKCSDFDNNIYFGDIEEDIEMKDIKKYHTLIKKLYINKYSSDKNYLVDIGSGHLRDLEFWDKANVKHVIAIEPSINSIEKANLRIEKYNPKIEINIIHGKGDDDWDSFKKYNILKNIKVDCITFNFTIHYMINNFSIVLNNILNISKSGTIIIIFCLNGELINSKLNFTNRYEIKSHIPQTDPIYGIYKMDKVNNLEEILVYFKDTYGVNKGSIEYIVYLKKLIEDFNKLEFKLLENKDLSQFSNYFKTIKLPGNQIHISKLHSVLVFKKI
jgi:hypothetical protein